MRFRLRRPLGILTGTIDKLLIVPNANGDGVDVEIIDFKTNRFQSRSKPGARQAKTAGPATAHSRERVVTAGVKEVRGQSAQGFFNFESAPEEVSLTGVSDDDFSSIHADTSVQDQIESVARDYQLQMQSYALALRELLPDDIRVRSLRATLHFIDPNVEASLPAALLETKTSSRAIDDAILAIASLDGTIDADAFPPSPASHCRMCNFLNLCSAGREWLRGSNPTPGGSPAGQAGWGGGGQGGC